MTKQADTAAAEMLEHITQAAHKGGYQIAVLAVKESSRGKQFSFNYEGVAGKPCKLLEQLFKELVTGCGDSAITSHIHESTTADYTTESAMQDTSTAVSLEAMDRSECLRDADKLDLLLDIASLIDTNRARRRRRGDDPMNKQSASKQSMTARHSDVSNSPANNSLQSNQSHAEQHQTLADESLPGTSNIPVADSRNRRGVSSHTKGGVSDTTVNTAVDQVVMDVSCLNVDRSIAKVSGKKYTSQLYGEAGIQTPDDYYPPMKEMTTTESPAATETVSGLPTDLIKMEPGCNTDEFNESLSQSYLEPTISKYGQGSSNQLDNTLSSSCDELSNTGGGAGNKLRSRSECISTIETTSRHGKNVSTSKRPSASITDGSSDSDEDEVHRDSQPSHKPSSRTQPRPISTDPGERPYSPTTNRSKRKKRSRLSSQLSCSKTPENKPSLEHACDDDPLDRPVTLRDIYALTNEIRLMRATVNSIDHNINRMNVTKEIPTALMTLPYFTSYEEMETWKPDDTEAIILNIVRIGGENYKKAASYALDKMIPLEIQEELNVHGHGTLGKLAFNKTEVYRVIVAALTSQFNESEISISKVIGRHLVGAGSKLKTKKKKVLKDL